MLVGATGSGKTTLVDGIVNYAMGVSFDDPFRFTLVQLEEEEKKMNNQVFCLRCLNCKAPVHENKHINAQLKHKLYCLYCIILI